MPQIRLHVRQADGDLPSVCMCCGQPATVTKTKKMQWCPPWVGILILAGLLPYAIVAMILTKRARVQAPFCDDHKGHWLHRALLMWGSFFLFGFLGLGAIVAAASLPQHLRENALGFTCLGGVVLLLIWLGIVIYAQNTGIRPKEITDNEILLDGVCLAFVDAVDESDREYEERRRERRRRRDDDEDELPRRRSSRGPSDAFEE